MSNIESVDLPLRTVAVIYDGKKYICAETLTHFEDKVMRNTGLGIVLLLGKISVQDFIDKSRCNLNDRLVTEDDGDLVLQLNEARTTCFREMEAGEEFPVEVEMLLPGWD